VTPILGFILECAAIAALTGTAASVLALGTVALQRSFGRRVSAGTRADLVFIAGVLPALVAVAATASAAMPSVMAALGLLADHCHGHAHHLHVCFVHGGDVQPGVALLGALALAMGSVRACSLVRHGLVFARDVRALERLGVAGGDAFPIVEIPGDALLCHAVGARRPRILLGTSFAARLAPIDLRCAIAHERAHLRRRDPLASVILSAAGLCVPPPMSQLLQRAYRDAAEEACDDEAARDVGDGTLVARALVAVARLQHQPAWPPASAQVFGFGQHRLEVRVHRLLRETAFCVRRAFALPVAAGAALAIFAAAAGYAALIHHAVETALHRLF